MDMVTGVTARWTDLVKHYVRSLRFVVDVICVLPLELPCYVLPSNYCDDKLFALLRLNRLLKVYKVISHI